MFIISASWCGWADILTLWPIVTDMKTLFITNCQHYVKRQVERKLNVILHWVLCKMKKGMRHVLDQRILLSSWLKTSCNQQLVICKLAFLILAWAVCFPLEASWYSLENSSFILLNIIYSYTRSYLKIWKQDEFSRASLLHGPKCRATNCPSWKDPFLVTPCFVVNPFSHRYYW